MSSIPVANFASCLGKYDTTMQGSVVSDSADYAGTGDISFNGGYILNTTAFVLPAPVTGNGISFSGWFYPTGVEATNTALFDVSCTPAATTSQIAVYFTGTNALSMTYNGTAAATSSNVYSTNAWNFFMYTVCCSGNVAIQNLYVNTIGTGANPATLTNMAGTYTQYTVNSTFLGFGVGSTFGVTKYVGKMDDFRFYSRVITPMEYRVLQGSNYGNKSITNVTPSLGTVTAGTSMAQGQTAIQPFSFSTSGTFAYLQISRTAVGSTTTFNISPSQLTFNPSTQNYTWTDTGLTGSTNYSYVFSSSVAGINGTSSIIGIQTIKTSYASDISISYITYNGTNYTSYSQGANGIMSGTSVTNNITYNNFAFLNTSAPYIINYASTINTYIYVLAVGGGGSGSNYGSNGQGGGGGGGGVVMMPVLLPTGTNKTITINVGAGAPSVAYGTTFSNGGLDGSNTTVQFSGNSSINIIAWGGGHGGGSAISAGSGGSGGGCTGNYYQSSVYTTFTPGLSNNTYNNFGNPSSYVINPNPLSLTSWSSNFALGGGGAGLSVPPITFANYSFFNANGSISSNNIGFNPNTPKVCSGGAGIQCFLPGICSFSPNGTAFGAYYWGGGGGAGSWYNPGGVSGNGGIGGGGGGGAYNTAAASVGGAGINAGSGSTGGFGGAGGANTGGGGGGSYFTSSTAPTAAGGSGIVVIAFPQSFITNNINAVLSSAMLSTGAYNAVLNSISTSAASSIQAAFSCKLINYNYFGPIFTLRSPMDMYGFNAQNFYADVCGNLGTRYLGTGQSLKNWLLSWGYGAAYNTNYAYVVKWYDQGNDICFNSALQYTWGSQPIYDLSSGCINFGYTGVNNSFTTAPQSNCYLNLPQGALPYNDTSYSYITRHGYISLSSTYVDFFAGGSNTASNAGIYLQLQTTSPYTYQANWVGTGLVTYNSAIANLISNNVVATTYTSGSGALQLYVNDVQTSYSTNVGTRVQLPTGNWIGGGGLIPGQTSYYFNGQMYNFFVFGSSINSSDRAIIQNTPYTYLSVPTITGVKSTVINSGLFVLSWTAVTNAQSYTLWVNNNIYGTVQNGDSVTYPQDICGGWNINLNAYDANYSLIASSVNGIVGGATVTGFYNTPTVSSYSNAIIFNGNSTIISPTSMTVQLLMVGGGGGGGNILPGTSNLNSSNGGGAGGVAAGSITLSANTLYTITVGAGGVGGVDGSFTSITGSDINIKVYGGGRGGNYNSVGFNGGCGGGGVNTAGTAITGTNTGTITGTITFSGNAGGLGIAQGRGNGGGGGGAGGGGGNSSGTGSTGNFYGGSGGSGYTWSVTGNVYAGGGGGGCGMNQIVSPYTNYPGTPGTGGGGYGGGYYNASGTSGIYYDSPGGNATFYGGGGGGCSQANSSNTSMTGGNGYQGCVIMAFNYTSSLPILSGLAASSVSSTGFVATWSGGTSGLSVTYSYTINGLSSGFTTSGTNPTTFSGLTGTSWVLVVTATFTGVGAGVITNSISVNSFLTYTYTYSGTNQTYTVPTGMTKMLVQAWGAGGASPGMGSTAYNVGSSGGGGYTSATFNVTGGNTYTVIVGQGGLTADSGAPVLATYGGGGGSVGGYAVPQWGAASGGGRSAVDYAGVELITAGGGGASGQARFTGAPATTCYGGGGGGFIGGGWTGLNLEDGSGGTQYSGGAAGYTAAGGTITAGSVYTGNSGGSGWSAGGGGGYFGGGGGGVTSVGYGGWVSGGGGGGSSYINPSYATTSPYTMIQGGNPTVANNSGLPSGLIDTIGYGIAANPVLNAAGSNGGNGLVIVSFYNAATTYQTISVSGYTYAFLYTANSTITLPSAKTVTVLIVAGGGGGGGGAANLDGAGGGGAGGVGVGILSFAAGTTYTITVGVGGTGTSVLATNALNGGNSSIVGGSINEVAYGGGYGQNTSAPGGTPAGSGGSGGGGWNNNGGTGTKGTGTLTYYGNAGGAGGGWTGGRGEGGGGGGAGGAGQGSSSGLTGGIGYYWSVTGLYYAGGGGGGSSNLYTNWTGGLGGGGNGGAKNTLMTATSGSFYGGGGGGGGGVTNPTVGGNGCQGCVIICYN